MRANMGKHKEKIAKIANDGPNKQAHVAHWSMFCIVQIHRLAFGVDINADSL